MFKHVKVGLCAVLFGLLPGSARAVPPAASLTACQNVVKAATQKFVTARSAAIGSCLQAVSTQIVKHNKPTASGAAAVCVTSFRKLRDGRGLGKQLSDKLAASITAQCAPGQPGVTHTLADILGTGAGVPQPLGAESLSARCSHFGGDGSIDSVGEWLSCVQAAAECDVDSIIAAQFPRVLEWLHLAQTAMQAVTPPMADPTKVTDAVAAVSAVTTELDPDHDDIVTLQCGARQHCGNALSENGEVCDGIDLNGQTCATQTPATPYGTLGCSADCTAFVTTGCVGRFVDNGDGTVTDHQTTLTWEKKDTTCPGPHCWTDSSYTWSTGTNDPDGTAFTVFLAGLNGGVTLGASTDGTTCAGGFAGHCDWRVPTVAELRSILLQSYPCGTVPCLDPVFGPTVASFFWSATRDGSNPARAWDVRFSNGSVQPFDSTVGDCVRGVRGVCSGVTCLASAAPSCTDGTVNGNETDVDCGGSCPACAVGAHCVDGSDCATSTCQSGICGGCLVAADCPPTNNECVVATCTANACGTQNLDSSHVLSTGQFPHDCQKAVCDGAGGTTFVDDPTDLPVYPTACVIPICAGPSPLYGSFTVAPTGTDCTADNQPPAHLCADSTGPAAGTCVECNTSADCGGGQVCLNTYCQ